MFFMPVTDPISDLLTRMRNAQKARRAQCRCPSSKHKMQICDVFKSAGFISDVTEEGEGLGKEIVVTFSPDHPSLAIKRVSKPGRRVYSGRSDLKPVLNGFGVAIVSTSEGVMTGKEAGKKGIGGEILCTVS